MRTFLFLAQLLTSILAAFNANTFAQLFLLNQYGNNRGRHDCRRVIFPVDGGPPRRRCRRTANNDIFRIALLSSLGPNPAAPSPVPTPVPTPGGCFPDAMTMERQTEEGSETISVASLVLGDKVRCLKATRGPRTAEPELGWCEFVSRGHNSNNATEYHQLMFIDDHDQEKMIAATDTHLVWRSTDITLKGPADPKKISIQNEMFVPIEDVNVGDVIVFQHDNQWFYRTVTDHRVKSMSGIRNPQFSDGGLPIVNGVLATTSVTTYRGGHWGAYFQYMWNDDRKFSNTSRVFSDFREHPFSLAQRKGVIKVDLECVMDRIFEAQDNGVNIVNSTTDYNSFVPIYLMPCVPVLPSLSELGSMLLQQFE